MRDVDVLVEGMWRRCAGGRRLVGPQRKHSANHPHPSRTPPGRSGETTVRLASRGHNSKQVSRLGRCHCESHEPLHLHRASML